MLHSLYVQQYFVFFGIFSVRRKRDVDELRI